MSIADDAQYAQDRADLLNSPLGAHFGELKRGIWHCTGPRGYAGIRSSGAIEPSDGRNPYTFPQTANSYARKKCYVSLFDFGAASDSECFSMHFKWTRFFSHFEPFTAVLELDRATLAERLVPASVARQPEAYGTVWIPHVEAWHAGPIPVSAVRRYLMVPNRRIAEATWLSPDDVRHADFERVAQSTQDLARARHNGSW